MKSEKMWSLRRELSQVHRMMYPASKAYRERQAQPQQENQRIEQLEFALDKAASLIALGLEEKP